MSHLLIWWFPKVRSSDRDLNYFFFFFFFNIKIISASNQLNPHFFFFLSLLPIFAIAFFAPFLPLFTALVTTFFVKNVHSKVCAAEAIKKINVNFFFFFLPFLEKEKFNG